MAGALLAGAQAALAALGLCAAVSAHAQAGAGISLAPSDALTCLAPAATAAVKPAYPLDAWNARAGATVAATLTFTAPDRPPEVRLQPPQGHEDFEEAFEDAIRAYAKQFRVPCLAPGAAPVVLRQGLVFEPTDGRKVAYSTGFVDAGDPDRARRLHCMKSESGAPGPYSPGAALRQGSRAGEVVLRLRFTRPDAPPAVTVLYNGGREDFANSVRGYVDGMRVPCLGESPVSTYFLFIFQMEGSSIGSHCLARDISPVNYLKSSRPESAGHVHLDTTQMQCPFDVRVSLRQPWEANEAMEPDKHVPARIPLLQWIAGLQLSLDSPEVQAEVFDEDITSTSPARTSSSRRPGPRLSRPVDSPQSA